MNPCHRRLLVPLLLAALLPFPTMAIPSFLHFAGGVSSISRTDLPPGLAATLPRLNFLTVGIFGPANFSATNVSLALARGEWCDNDCQGPSPNETGTMEGRVILWPYEVGTYCLRCPTEMYLDHWLNQTGALASAVFVTGIPGHTVLYRHAYGDPTRVSRPFLSFPKDIGEPLIAWMKKDTKKDMKKDRPRANNTATYRLRVTFIVETNPWHAFLVSPSWIVWQVLLGLGCLVVVIMTCRRLVGFIRHVGACRCNIPQSFLCMQLAMNLWRLMYIAVDPLGTRSIFSFNFSRASVSIPFSMGYISTMLIALFWFDMTSSYRDPTSTACLGTKARFAFISLAIFVSLAEVVMLFTTMYSGYVDVYSFTIIAGVYGVRLTRRDKRKEVNGSFSVVVRAYIVVCGNAL